jgi:hypothetical protein
VVAYFAREGGFTKAELPEAVAIALAASGGDDAWRWLDIRAGFEERGLWALDRWAFEELADADLWSPTVSAAAAKGLYDAHGGSWGWHRASGSAHVERWRAVALEASRRPSPYQSDSGSNRIARDGGVRNLP